MVESFLKALPLTSEYMHLGAYISRVSAEKVHIPTHIGRYCVPSYALAGFDRAHVLDLKYPLLRDRIRTKESEPGHV